MTSHSPKEQSPYESVQLVSYAQPEDEIDLVDLWRLIMGKKHFLVLGLVFAWLLAGAWFFFVKPAYEVEARLIPATPKMLAELQVVGSEKQYAPLVVFKRYLNNFNSISNKRHFFDQNNLLTHFSGSNKTADEQALVFIKKFKEKLQLTFDRKQAFPEYAEASFVLDDAHQGARWLDQYMDYVHQITLDNIFSEIEERLLLEKKALNDQIKIKIVSGKQQRDDQIAKLDEALIIARQLGIKSTDAFSITSKKGQTAVEVNTQNQPLYTRGIEALSAELEILKARKSDEPFITGLRPLEEKLAQLETLKPDKSKTRAVIVDQRANIPEHAKNKKKSTILAFSTLLGLILGFFLIFIQHFLGRVKDAETSLNIESK